MGHSSDTLGSGNKTFVCLTPPLYLGIRIKYSRYRELFAISLD